MRVSASKIKTFKACRRAYQLKYIYDVVPVETSEALSTGLDYHGKIEAMYRGDHEIIKDLSKTEAMFYAYRKYVYPYVHIAPDHVEVDISDTIKIGESGLAVEIVGRLDGIAEDGALVEHKTVSAEITEQYEYDLGWDEQLLMYMLLTGARKCYYTVCRKPTIRLRKGETEEEFFCRMVAWYDEDTDSKIRLLKVERTDEDIRAFKAELEDILSEMSFCEEFTKHFYKNSLHCFRFGRRCEYAEICQFYDSNADYINYKKGGRLNEGNENTGAGELF